MAVPGLISYLAFNYSVGMQPMVYWIEFKTNTTGKNELDFFFKVQRKKEKRPYFQQKLHSSRAIIFPPLLLKVSKIF